MIRASAAINPRAAVARCTIERLMRDTAGAVGDALDNTLAETTIGLYKIECVRARRSGAGPSPP